MFIFLMFSYFFIPLFYIVTFLFSPYPGNIVTFRPSAFKVVDSAQDFDFDDLIVPLPNGSSSSGANQPYLPEDTYFPDWKEQDMVTAGIAIDGLHSNIDDANDWELGLGLGL